MGSCEFSPAGTENSTDHYSPNDSSKRSSPRLTSLWDGAAGCARWSSSLGGRQPEHSDREQLSERPEPGLTPLWGGVPRKQWSDSIWKRQPELNNGQPTRLAPENERKSWALESIFAPNCGKQTTSYQTQSIWGTTGLPPPVSDRVSGIPPSWSHAGTPRKSMGTTQKEQKEKEKSKRWQLGQERILCTSTSEKQGHLLDTTA